MNLKIQQRLLVNPFIPYNNNYTKDFVSNIEKIDNLPNKVLKSAINSIYSKYEFPFTKEPSKEIKDMRQVLGNLICNSSGLGEQWRKIVNNKIRTYYKNPLHCIIQDLKVFIKNKKILVKK